MTRLIGFLAILLLLSAADSAPSCFTVNQKVVPCLSFVRGGSSDQPSEACCKGANDLSGQTKSQADRQAVCQCLKKVLSTIGNYDPSQVSLLPMKCGLSLSLPAIDKNTDCSKAAMFY